MCTSVGNQVLATLNREQTLLLLSFGPPEMLQRTKYKKMLTTKEILSINFKITTEFHVVNH
mgnify:CR=1 FL=1